MISKIIGILLMISSLTMLPPILVSILFNDQMINAFLGPFLEFLILGFVLWFMKRREKKDLQARDGFLIVVLFWLVISLTGSIPFLNTPNFDISLTNAIFESTSGYTTTGATILQNINQLPPSLLYYRQQMHLLGGMGIIVLAVAVLPMLGIGGMQLYRAETPGPMKETKLTPRITGTAKALWSIYGSLVICCIFSLWVAGMPLFNAIGESFSIVSTGGFSMHDSSFAYYHSQTFDIIAVIFMILGATNFALLFKAIRDKNITICWKDEEYRLFISILFLGCGVVIAALAIHHAYGSAAVTITNSIFTTTALLTTTGLKTTSFHQWPTFLPYLIMILAIIGGCGGSTTGGIKMMRFLVMIKQALRELKLLIHPHAIYTLKINKHPLPNPVLQAVWAFITVFVLSFMALMLILLATGMNFTTAFGALVATLANAGAPIGDLATTFRDAGTFSKWILIVAMLAGRLEIFTLLVLLTPEFWRK